MFETDGVLFQVRAGRADAEDGEAVVRDCETHIKPPTPSTLARAPWPVAHGSGGRGDGCQGGVSRQPFLSPGRTLLAECWETRADLIAPPAQGTRNSLQFNNEENNQQKTGPLTICPESIDFEEYLPTCCFL